jgi:hypothetical protein
MTAKAVFLVDIMGWNIPVASGNPPENPQRTGSTAGKGQGSYSLTKIVTEVMS